MNSTQLRQGGAARKSKEILGTRPEPPEKQMAMRPRAQGRLLAFNGNCALRLK